MGIGFFFFVGFFSGNCFLGPKKIYCIEFMIFEV